MGKSSDIEWMLSEMPICYLVSGKTNHKKLHFVFMPFSRIESLNSIIHEINECEINELLKKFGWDKKVEINVTKSMVRKYPDIFKRPMRNVSLSHILSPFGVTNSFLPRKTNRALW